MKVRGKSTLKSTKGLNIIGRRKLWYGLSVGLLLPVLISLIVFGLNLGIDFTGGSSVEVRGTSSSGQVEKLLDGEGISKRTITRGEQDSLIINFRSEDNIEESQTQIKSALEKGGFRVVRFDEIGPSVSKDLARNALTSVILMSLAVVIYISWAFRSARGRIPAYKFGAATLVAAFCHDGLFVVGSFALLGKLFGVQVDSYIVTAILTVIAFSIHDTVVVFDRVREKLDTESHKVKLEEVVNSSINETIVRSLNTSLVIVVVLLALVLFGGQSIRYFVLALLLGMVAGTYSSIFIAAPLLVSWQKVRKT